MEIFLYAEELSHLLRNGVSLPLQLAVNIAQLIQFVLQLVTGVNDSMPDSKLAGSLMQSLLTRDVRISSSLNELAPCLLKFIPNHGSASTTESFSEPQDQSLHSDPISRTDRDLHGRREILAS